MRQQASELSGVLIGMADFGTGLRAHIEHAREPVVLAEPAAAAIDPRLEELDAERRRIEALALDLAGRELGLAQREAELAAAQERLALTLAKALIRAAGDANVPPPLDELAVARARRFA